MALKFTTPLRKNAQFRLVYNKGKFIANKHLVMVVLPNGGDANRLGLSVSKKVGKSVQRNRVTRLIKESYRLTESMVKPGFDIVIIARTTAKPLSFFEMMKNVRHLLRKHQLLVSDNQAGNMGEARC